MLQLKNITKKYTVGENIVHALNKVSVDFRESEFVAVLGPSGCGKTTLLNIVGGLDSYTSGDLIINGKSTKDYGDADWDAYRNHSVGFVFQSYNLIAHQSVLSNVEIALRISGISKAERRKRATEALEKVGLGDQLNKKPNMMSGGQMQRVAIARALVNDPDIILADEPTGALDSETSLQVMDLLKEVAKDRLVIMVTHNPDLANTYATRVIQLKDGKVVSDSKPVTEAEHSNIVLSQGPTRTKLGFMAALSLSLNNLMTKKGRTILTSFAGAIGIIGIALILALSNGMNDYISQIESDTMGSYPIELEKETIDMNAMMNGGSDAMSQMLLGEQEDDSTNDDAIVSNNIVASSIEESASLSVKNNLGSFKTYLDDNSSSIEESLSAVEYGYDITPQVFRENETDEFMQVSPSTLTDSGSQAGASSDAMNGMASAMSGMGGMGGSSSSASLTWTQIADNEGLREQQYELLEGSWPTEANEVALVLDQNNQISDYTLYMLGLMDIENMDALVTAIENGEDYEDEQVSFSYNKAIGLEFKVFAQSELHKESDDGSGVWIDKSQDADYLAQIYEEGYTVTVTAVLKVAEDSDATSGVVYTGALSRYLLDAAENSDVVTQQLADPETNVLTGELFESDDASNTVVESGSSNTDESSDNTATDNANNVATDAAMSEQYPASAMSDMGADSASLMSTMSDDQIAVLIAQMSSDTPQTYEDVLIELGYADIDEPATIALYPTDFDGKTAIETFITDYNNQVEDEADRVTYTDIVGTMTSSISSIVDIISYILIAFVAISLIVSSIMIAIITYISVLERTKEIGVLRAIGASKNDISKIFNAETVIEGLASGVIGICVALLACIPINAVISSMFGAENIASLPLEYSLVLIAISVVLNLIAGFIPSRMAAKKDPVVALRTE